MMPPQPQPPRSFLRVAARLALAAVQSQDRIGPERLRTAANVLRSVFGPRAVDVAMEAADRLEELADAPPRRGGV